MYGTKLQATKNKKQTTETSRFKGGTVVLIGTGRPCHFVGSWCHVFSLCTVEFGLGSV